MELRDAVTNFQARGSRLSSYGVLEGLLLKDTDAPLKNGTDLGMAG